MIDVTNKITDIGTLISELKALETAEVFDKPTYMTKYGEVMKAFAAGMVLTKDYVKAVVIAKRP